jgi:hypothetical protein
MPAILILIPDKSKGNRALTGLLPIYEIFGLDTSVSREAFNNFAHFKSGRSTRA